jgi:phage minor structural protein
LLIIKDLMGNVEALTDITECEVYEEVNGDFSIFFTSFLTEKNEHSFPLIQEESIVELDGNEFRIKKLDEKRNIKVIEAQHVYFDLIDEQIYTYIGGTKTIDEVFQFILSGTNWTFENVDVTHSELLANFGEDNALTLIRKACEVFKCEIKIEPNNHLKICREIGEITDAQFRYKTNIKTLRKSTDSSNLSTVIKGYGSNGLEVEYRSPNVDIYGEKHAEAIRDDRYTIAESLLERLKKELKDYPDVSIEVETLILGFDVNLGDKVWMIYEPINLDFQTRIISRKYYPFSQKSPSVTFSNKVIKIEDNLVQAKVEMKENQKETRSKFDQTNEKITLEVERIDESISTIEQTADSISLSVQTLDTRVGTAEASIEIQAGQIFSKVSQTDYNGNTIASLINQTATDITIEASKVNLNGYVTITNLSTPGQTIIDGSNITTGTMSADRIFGGWLRFSNFSSLYEINEPYTTLVFSSGGYKFEAGGTIDFQNNPITGIGGLNVVASFG